MPHHHSVSGLTGFKISLDNPWRLKILTTDVTETGFTLHTNAWRDSELSSVGAAWVAYPAGDPVIHSARLDVRTPGSWKRPMRLQQNRQCHTPVWGLGGVVT